MKSLCEEESKTQGFNRWKWFRSIKALTSHSKRYSPSRSMTQSVTRHTRDNSLSQQHDAIEGFLFKTTEDPSCQKVTLKGYLEHQKAMKTRSWPSFNMWRVGSENGLFFYTQKQMQKCSMHCIDVDILFPTSCPKKLKLVKMFTSLVELL